MFEQFKNELLSSLSGEDQETLQRLSRALNIVGSRYEFMKKETALSVRDGSLPQAARDYLVTRKIEGLSPSTLRLYKLVLENFFKDCLKPLPLITANDLRIYLYKYKDEHQITNRSLDTMRICISAFFTWACSNDYLEKNPAKTLKAIKYEKTRRPSLTQMELEQIRHACKDPRETALIEFLYSTGCRVSEVAGAKLSDIDWNKNELVVLGKGNKHRTVYLNAKSVVSLKAYILSRHDQTDCIFASVRAPYSPMTVRSIEYTINNIVSRCPDISKTVSPHIFRHTTATVAIQSMPVQDVQRILGHNSIETTMIYADINESSVKLEHQKYVI